MPFPPFANLVLGRSSSHTAVVPFGDRFGVPSGQTVATKPRRCSSTTRFMSSVNAGT